MADELNTNGSDAAEAAPVIETPADSAAVLAALEAAAQTAQDEAADYKDRWLRAGERVERLRLPRLKQRRSAGQRPGASSVSALT